MRSTHKPLILPAMPGKIQVWKVDCPWHYAQRPTHSKTKFGGGTTTQYPTMKDKELLTICDYIRENSAPDAAMFSWCTAPRMLLGLFFILRCGFRVSTKAFAWEKVNADGSPATGPGAYTASNTEDVMEGVFDPNMEIPDTFKEWLEYLEANPEALEEMQDCYLGVRGSFTPDNQGGRRMLNQVIRAPRGVHSAKPEEAFHRIEAMFPNAVKCELFARKRRPGWICIGNEIDGLDVRAALSQPLDPTELNKTQQADYEEFAAQWIDLATSGLNIWHIQQLLLQAQ